MENYGLVAHHFPDPPDNKGLEGITVNTRNNHVVVVKERQPGLLIELDSERFRPSTRRPGQARLLRVEPRQHP